MPHTYPHSTSVLLDIAVKRLRAEQASVISTFGAAGDGTTDDTAAFQQALNDIDAAGGGMLYVPGGYTYSVGDITIPTGNNPIYMMGEGMGSLIVKRGTSTPSGTGWWDASNSSNKVFRGLCFDAAYTAAPLGVDFGSISGDPLEALWSDNSSFWLHDSCDNVTFDHVKFRYSAGYSLIGQANLTDLTNLQLLYLELENCRPRLLGYSSGPQIYGGYNGGVLLVGNGTSTTAMVRECKVDHFRASRVTGNAFWTHLYGYSSLHENIDLVNPYGRDIGRDFIQIGGCSGVSISDVDGRRVGYTTVDDTSASVPRYAANQWAVGIDFSGENYSVSITGGELTSCNGGYIDGDGLGNATISGITLRTPRSTDEEYAVDGIGSVGWGGSVVAGRDFAYGFQPGNTANAQFGGENIEISGCSFINLSGGAIKGYAMRNGHIHNNNIQMPANPGIQPIILGNVGTGPFQRAVGNVVHGNRVTYPVASSAPVVFEDSSLGAFSTGDKNWVFDNPIVSSTDDAYEFYRDAGTSSTTRTVHSSEFPALAARSEHWVERQGEPSSYTSVLTWNLQEGTSSWQHMRLQGYWASGQRGPLLNVSEGGTGGVIATGSRTTSVFSDAVVTGKIYGDSFLALTDTTYADADADLLPGTTWLLRYKHATGFPEQSLTVSGGHRVWTPFGSTAVGGSDKSVQYNKSGVMFGDANFEWDYTNKQIILTGVDATAGLVLDSPSHTAFVQSAGGFFTTSTAGTAIQAPLGGVLALQLAVARTSPTQIYTFVADSSQNLVLGDATAAATRLLLSKLGVFTIGSTVAIDQAGNITLSGVLECNGSSGGVNVISDTANNSIQTVGGVLAKYLGASKNVTALPTGGLTDIVAQFANADGSITRVVVDGFGAIPAITFRRANNTNASPSAILSGDELGVFSFRGYTGSGYSATTTQFAGFAAENWSGSATGAYLTFSTTTIGTTSAAERMRIDSTGHVFINATLDDNSGAVLQLAGFVSATNGYYTASSSATAIQAPNGGVTTTFLIANEALNLKALSSSPTSPAAGYGALGYKTGSQYWYWNGSAYALVDFSSVGGSGVSSLNTLTGALSITNGTGVTVTPSRLQRSDCDRSSGWNE